ncbi:hypothetical protein ACWKX9_26860, partial [Enterobacter asburiae]
NNTRSIIIFFSSCHILFLSFFRKPDYLIFTTGRESVPYPINTGSLSKSVNGCIRACWPYRGERMWAGGVGY